MNDMKVIKLTAELLIMKDYNIKPNISDLSREFGLSRATIRKYIEHNGIPPRKTPVSSSKWDTYADEIASLFEKGHTSKRAVYNFLANKYLIADDFTLLLMGDTAIKVSEHFKGSGKDISTLMEENIVRDNRKM